MANYDKLALYVACMDASIGLELSNLLNMTLGELPFNYLGVPLSHQILTVKQCMPLVDSIIKRVNHWTCKSLTYDGRLILIKSVLDEMQSY